MIPLAAAVTVAFFFLLRALGTANLLPSTVSVTTSFLAVYLLFRRSPFYALAYAANDIVLIVLWAMAAMEDISYFSVLICFAVFLANDVYGFISWLKMDKWQNERISEKHDNYIKKIIFHKKPYLCSFIIIVPFVQNNEKNFFFLYKILLKKVEKSAIMDLLILRRSCE